MMADADLLLRAFKMSVDPVDCPYNCGHVCPEDFERCIPDDNKVQDCWVDFWLKKAEVGWTAPLQDENARLEADLAAARTELAKHQPEEREFVCSCGGCMIECGGRWAYRELETDGRRNVGEPALWDMNNCPECGDALDPPQAHRYARRNADAARVQRVREALDALVVLYADCDDSKAIGVLASVNAIRAALDGGGEGE